MAALLAFVEADGTVAVLALAFLLGALVGIERELFSHSCGIRPCVIVALAAAGFSDLVVTRVPEANWGNGFGAIATGVGFLGAGVILKGDGPRGVHGISTAATIWAVAIIGTLIGARELVSGIALAGFVLAVNLVLRPVAVGLARRRAGATSGEVMDG